MTFHVASPIKSRGASVAAQWLLPPTKDRFATRPPYPPRKTGSSRFAAYAAHVASGDEATATQDPLRFATAAIALIFHGERLPAPDERPVPFVLRIIHSVIADAIARALDERLRGSPD